MAATDETVLIRHLQGLAVLLASLPKDGKAKEFLSLALAADEGPVLDKLKAPEDPDNDEAMKAWFESLWAQEAASGDEKKLVDWQADSGNMAGALAELQAVASKVSS
jgi:hypothetical protein